MLTELKNKINRLIALYEQTNAELNKVLQEKEAMATIIDEKNKKIKELEKKIDRLALADAFKISSGDKQEAKQKIGKIVREIEKCIAMLNN